MAIPSAPPQKELKQASSGLQLILVHPEDTVDTKVTFDDNSTENVWSYHEPASKPHITEIFEVQPVGGLNVKILGLATPGGDRLELSVVEDTMGVPDRFPRFRQSAGDIQVLGAVTLHSEFTQENDTSSRRIAFSFVTDRDPIRVYLVPRSDSNSQIETKVTNDPQYYFEFGPTISEKELKKIEKESGGGAMKK
jgi:hypothetical protein